MTNPERVVVGITAVGPDKKGIVAAFTKFAFERGGNIEEIDQNVVDGLFGMYLEVSFAEGIDMLKLDDTIQDIATQYGMEVSVHHETGLEKNIALMVTKEPHCLEALISGRDSLGGNLSVVIGTSDDLSDMAGSAGIPFVHVGDRNQKDAEWYMIKVCQQYDIDLVVLARYMRILTPNFVWRYPNRIINIHPSLLPAFPGAAAYAQAYKHGVKIAGVTAHYVSEDLDQGPIIFQDSFEVDPGDTLDEIKKKGQQIEATTLFEAVRMHLSNSLDVRWRKVYTRNSDASSGG